MPYISWEKYHFSWLLLTTIIKRSLSGMLPEAADEVRNSGKMKAECYFETGISAYANSLRASFITLLRMYCLALVYRTE